jgi:hypothetical protein
MNDIRHCALGGLCEVVKGVTKLRSKRREFLINSKVDERLLEFARVT